mgnify:FL=1
MSIETKIAAEELQCRLAALHHASLELVQEISIDSLLPRIARIASEQIGAADAAVALRGEDGQIERLITVGMEEKDAADLDHQPLGLGLLGVIADADSPIRVDYIQKDS